MKIGTRAINKLDKLFKEKEYHINSITVNVVEENSEYAIIINMFYCEYVFKFIIFNRQNKTYIIENLYEVSKEELELLCEIGEIINTWIGGLLVG